MNALRPIVCSLALLCLAGCTPREDRTGLRRRAVSPASQNGWARVPLDGEAQRSATQLWLGDADGHSIPFELERDGLWTSRALELDKVLTGRDPKNQPSVQFRLRFPEGWQVRQREHLHLELELEGASPWVCRAEVERRLDGGDFLRLERESPLHLYDLTFSGSKRNLTIPWDAREYRVTLIPTQGQAPSIRGLKVIAATQPEALQSDEVLEPSVTPLSRIGRVDAAAGEAWRLELPGLERIVGAEVVVKAPVAPVQPHFYLPLKTAQEEGASTYLAQSGLVWNLPALDTRASRMTLGPLLTDRLELSLPEGVRLDHVKLLVRRDVLLFPAEAGRVYYLHEGGRVRRAPGNLGTLPDSSGALYARSPLRLGPGEADPQGLPRLIEAGERTRPWLPWAAGLAVAVLGLFAWRLFSPKAE